MKWFIKCLRHYADFSGRARRKEYWMFALFNLIFLFAWAFLIALFAGSFDSSGAVMSSIYMSWFALLGLPGLAVAVRRLHDLGKSGWMLLIALIPIVGQIWFIVLMCTEGQAGANRFGPDPKTSPETFADRAKLTSAGVVLTVGSSLALLMDISSRNMPPVFMILNIVLSGLLLAAGIALIRSREREKAGTALWLVLVSSGAIVLWRLIDLARFGRGFLPVWYAYLLLFMALGILAAALLFAPRNKSLVRGSALAAIVLSCLAVLCRLWMMRWIVADNPQGMLDLLTLVSPTAYIILAWTFLSKKEEPCVAAETQISGTGPRSEADGHAVYDPSSPATPSEGGGSGKSLAWKIFGLLVSVGLIVGGLSGEMVLRGTESSEALVIVGIVLLIIDIFSLATHNKSNRKRQEYEQRLTEGAISSVELSAPATIRVVRDSSVVGMIVPYKVYLNHRFVGNIANGKSLDIETHVSHNIVTVFDNADNPFAGDFKADLEAGGYAEVHVKAGRFMKK